MTTLAAAGANIIVFTTGRGVKSIEDISDLLWKKLVDVCNEEKTNTEKLGFEEDIGIWRA